MTSRGTAPTSRSPKTKAARASIHVYPAPLHGPSPPATPLLPHPRLPAPAPAAESATQPRPVCLTSPETHDAPRALRPNTVRTQGSPPHRRPRAARPPAHAVPRESNRTPKHAPRPANHRRLRAPGSQFAAAIKSFQKATTSFWQRGSLIAIDHAPPPSPPSPRAVAAGPD